MFKNLKIRSILIVGFTLVVSFLQIMGGLFITENIKSSTRSMIHDQINNIKTSVKNLIELTSELDIERLQVNISTVDKLFQNSITLSSDEKDSIQTYSLNGEKSDIVTVPCLEFNGKPLYEDNSLFVRLMSKKGMVASLFQVVPGGMVRIATTVLDKNGKYAIGSMISEDSPVYQAISAGKSYTGRSFVQNEWLIATYKPVFDRKNKLIGCYGIGFPLTEFLQKKLSDYKVLEKGYVEVFDTSYRQVMHPDSTLLGKIRDDENHKKMVQMKEGTFKGAQQSSINNRKNIQKEYHFFTLPDYNWVVAVSVYQDDLDAPLRTASWILFLIVLLCIVATLTASFFLSNFITRILAFVRDRLQNILDNREKADLTKKIDYHSTNELGEVVKGLNQLLANLNHDIGRVEGVARLVAEGSDKQKDLMEKNVFSQISGIRKNIQSISDQTDNSTAGLEELTATVEEMARNIDSMMVNMSRQASAVEEAASSIEEMTRNIQNTAQISNKTSSISNQLNEMSSEGSMAVKESIHSIREVSDYSQQILKMLGLISNIAKQTNLLAMNAAIEAAHAGEAGKGFAIVADEIRRLSEDTNKNARDISEVVTTIVGRIDDSVRLSEKAGTGLDMIIAYSNQNVDVISQLNTAMQEQSSGAQEILLSTQELVRITEEVKLSMIEQKNATDDFSQALVSLRDLTISNSGNIKEHFSTMGIMIEALEKIKGIILSNQEKINDLKVFVDRFILDKSAPEEPTSLKLVE